MEFHEKLQELRKGKGLTQEELAEALYVSRTAISKWESGRGYPNIDSLKEISKYFSVSIDDLLSGEKLLSVAEKEHILNIRNLCGWLFGMADLFFFLLIVLPLYPNKIGEYVSSVNLFAYMDCATFIRIGYWVMFVALIAAGAMKIILIKAKPERHYKIVTDISLVIHILLVLFLALTREVYAVVVTFLLLVVKVALLLKAVKK